jgi:hypothetical protein
MRFSIFLLALLSSIHILGQKNQTYGGSHDDISKKVIYDNKGFFYTVGNTSSSGITDTTYGDSDAWVLKMDSNLNIVWSKAYGGNNYDIFNDFTIINDKLYCVGYTLSDSGDIVFNHGNADFWLAVIDTSGNLLFDSCYGGQEGQIAFSILQYPDSHLIISGISKDSTGQISTHFGSYDFWIIEVDTLGNLIREKSIGGPGYDYLTSSALLPDGNILFAGFTTTPNGAFNNYHGGMDGAAACIDSNWNSKYQMCYGESNSDRINKIYVKNIDTVLFTGFSISSSSSAYGSDDAVIWQINRYGYLTDSRLYGGNYEDKANDIIMDTDSTYLIIGETKSYAGLLKQNFGENDVFVFQTDLSLNPLKINNYGGSENDMGIGIFKHNDSSIVIFANTQSNDIQVPFNHGYYDLWILDTVFLTNTTSVNKNSYIESKITVFPNPAESGAEIFLKGLSPKTRNYELHIYNPQGQLISNKRFTANISKNIQLPPLPAGIYYLRLINENKDIFTYKFIIARGDY